MWWNAVECSGSGGMCGNALECGRMCCNVAKYMGLFWRGVRMFGSVMNCVGLICNTLECCEMCENIVECGGKW